jgi:hypothetical protein
MTPTFNFAYAWKDRTKDLYIHESYGDSGMPVLLYTNDLRYAKLFDAQGSAFNWKLEHGSSEGWDLLRVSADDR